MEVSSQLPKAEVRWRRQGVGGANGAANPNDLLQQQQRIDALTRNLASAAVTEGDTMEEETDAMQSPLTKNGDDDSSHEDRLAPLPSGPRFSNSDRRKSDLKNRKTSTAVAAAAAGLKTSPDVSILPKHGSSFSVESSTTIDWSTAVAFLDKRHVQDIEGSKAMVDSLRVRDRMVKMKTVSVALVLCLNVGVDPPDVIKPNPCARLECWYDPLANTSKALDEIGAKLQRQYETWQPRARYKQSLDPTVDDIRKLCSSLRRNAKEERVLFHYNGHGVPKPTVNGEIWVFNKNFTQYIPLSVYDLQNWMGGPSIYVYDCNNAGIIVESFKAFAVQREQELENYVASNNGQSAGAAAAVSMSHKNCIQLGACQSNEILPMKAELPADLFTSCLTTPIRIALRWFVMQNSGKLLPSIGVDLLDKIPGQMSDRRTMLGELNWVFTAVTDTIAWNSLPRDLFHKLFRQDLLLASLFRHFLLAERIMRSFNCTPVSSPKLPPTHQHPMWQAWDHTLDLCLSQLPGILQEKATYVQSSFFAEQLTAFQVWLGHANESRSPPEQLPIVLQVLLSQIHRLRALDLLGRFLDLGPWAVGLALSVGIFPYILKLLQSNARELRSHLVFIWAKILAVDASYQADLVKDNGHRYFLAVLGDHFMPAERRTMAAFILSTIVRDFDQGKEVAHQELIATCIYQIADKHAHLRQWLAICLGQVWNKYPTAKWVGVRNNAHEELFKLLEDVEPEVRAAAVFALGTFVGNVIERTDHANHVDHSVGHKLISLTHDGSPLVRLELTVALHHLVLQFEPSFAQVAVQFMEEERTMKEHTWHGHGTFPATMTNESGIAGDGGSTLRRMFGSMNSPITDVTPVTSPAAGSESSLDSTPANETAPATFGIGGKIPRNSSSTSLSTFFTGSNVYLNVWKALIQLISDPDPKVADHAVKIVGHIKGTVRDSDSSSAGGSTATTPSKTRLASLSSTGKTADGACFSAPSSPSNKGLTALTNDNAESTNPNDAVPVGGSAASLTRSQSNLQQRPTSPHPSTNVTSSTLPRNSSSASAGVANNAASYSFKFTGRRGVFEGMPESSVLRGGGGGGGGLMANKKNFVPKEPFLMTEFCAWSSKCFAQPVFKSMQEDDPEGPPKFERQWRFERNAIVRTAAKISVMKGHYRIYEEVFINRNNCVPTILKFHPFESQLAVADKESVTVWNWENNNDNNKINSFLNLNPKYSRITAMDFLNPHDVTLLLTGCDDGTVRIWRGYDSIDSHDTKLLSSFQGLADMIPGHRSSGMILKWSQESSTLVASGDVRHVRLWDVKSERKIQDIPTGADSCVTSLAYDLGSTTPLIIAGCGDGSVRLFDKRTSSQDSRVMTLREHQGWVVNVHAQRGVNGKIISASVNGDVRFWDPRSPESVLQITTDNNLQAFEVHPMAAVFACGSMQQMIKIYSISGEPLHTMKFHDGWTGQRLGPISCLDFHPWKIALASGSTDSFISVYRPKR